MFFPRSKILSIIYGIAFFEGCIFGHIKKVGHYADNLIDYAPKIVRKTKILTSSRQYSWLVVEENLSREYWIRVLKKDKWENSKNDDDIMPSIKVAITIFPSI
jgi:hypothetical protein